MSDTISQGGLGHKAFTSDVDQLGEEAVFEDINLSSTEQIKPKLSQMKIYARWVRNTSGGTLSPGAAVRWDETATYGPGKGIVDTAVIATDELVAGFVDPYITGTVAANEHFWLIEKGPAKALFTTGTTLDENDPLLPGAAGRVTKSDVSTASAAQNQHLCGFSLEAVDTGTADDTLFRIYAIGQFYR